MYNEVTFKDNEIKNIDDATKYIRKLIIECNGIGMKVDVAFIKDTTLDNNVIQVVSATYTMQDTAYKSIYVVSKDKFKFNNRSSMFQGGIFGTLSFDNFDFTNIVSMDNMFKDITVDDMRIAYEQDMTNCISAVSTFENMTITKHGNVDLHNIDFSHGKVSTRSMFYNLHADTLVLPNIGDNYDKIFTPINIGKSIDISIRHIKNAGDNMDKIEKEIKYLYKILLAQYYDQGSIEFNDDTPTYEGLHELLDLELDELIIER